MRMTIPISLLLLFAALNSVAQTTLSWKQLADVEFKTTYFTKKEINYRVPVFGKELRAYAGKEVLVSGYIIPLDASGKSFVLSKYPYASCFFCGGAGPETVVELQFNAPDKRRYKLDEKLTFKGIFALNASDSSQFNYIIKNVEVVK